MKLSFGKLAAAALTVTMLIGAIPASAHMGWTQTNTPIVAMGDNAYVELLVGNHTNEHRSYRVDANWGSMKHNTYVFTPSGEKVDISGTEFYTGENDPSVKNSNINNEYIASFNAQEPGAYIISSQGESIASYSGYPALTKRSAKSFVAVSDIVAQQRVQSLKGFQRQVSPDRAEWIPLFNPAAVKPGQTLKAQYLVRGVPMADVHVNVIRRSTKEALDLTTDKDGVVTYTAGAADYYLVAAKPEVKEKVEGQYDAINFEATMTYAVQNGALKVKTSKIEAVPDIYFNGKEITLNGIAKVNGQYKIHINALKAGISPNISGKGSVELRQVLEASGYRVEIFDAVGAIPSMIVIRK